MRTAAGLWLAMAAMGKPGTKVGEPCRKLGIQLMFLKGMLIPRDSKPV
jgi:hypothetical protein